MRQTIQARTAELTAQFMADPDHERLWDRKDLQREFGIGVAQANLLIDALLEASVIATTQKAGSILVYYTRASHGLPPSSTWSEAEAPQQAAPGGPARPERAWPTWAGRETSLPVHRQGGAVPSAPPAPVPPPRPVEPLEQALDSVRTLLLGKSGETAAGLARLSNRPEEEVTRLLSHLMERGELRFAQIGNLRIFSLRSR